MGAPATREALLDRAAAYARTVDLDLDVTTLEWEISERAKRRAGGCRYDPETGQVTVVLTWEAYREFGWAEFTATIRHELVHAWEFTEFGESGHGERFRERAAAIDAPRHCRPFTEGRLEMVCTSDDCGWRPERHRASKPIKRPDGGYRCGECGAAYFVRHVDTGRTWRTATGYEAAREAIGDEW
jgi:predicted SprT family Zn-dependent metalloprotease